MGSELVPALAQKILDSRIVVDDDGNEYPLHSDTPLSQCKFIQSIIEDIDASKCLEIGMAYGISAMFVTEAIRNKPHRQFISIDPMQGTDWHNVGLLNLERIGVGDFVRFLPEFSSTALPKLSNEGLEIDFAFVDTTKIFDQVLIDAYYVIKLLRVGGVVVFDDCTWPGIRQLARYIARLPHLEVYGRHFEYRNSAIKRVASAAASIFPFKHRIFADDILVTDESLGTNAKCVAFRKLSDDVRPWDWYVNS